MPQPRKSQIDFGDDQVTRRANTWSAVSDLEMQRRAHSPMFRGVERIEAAARWRMDSTGHAGFAPGELEKIIGTRRARTYELIAEAVDRGVIEDGSNPLCLLTPWYVGQRATAARPVYCRVRHRFSTGEAED